MRHERTLDALRLDSCHSRTKIGGKPRIQHPIQGVPRVPCRLDWPFSIGDRHDLQMLATRRIDKRIIGTSLSQGRKDGGIHLLFLRKQLRRRDRFGRRATPETSTPGVVGEAATEGGALVYPCLFLCLARWRFLSSALMGTMPKDLENKKNDDQRNESTTKKNSK